MALIEFRGVKKAFGKKVVYSDLNLAINQGEALTVIGGSGQGKSVMLKMLIGLMPVDAGKILYQGRVISGLSERDYLPVRREIAMLFQASALFDSLNVYENIAYGVREHENLSEEQIAERVTEALSYVGLEGMEKRAPSDLSGGMRKRVGLARALAIRPKVLLYDEPTTGLDPLNVQRISELIRHVNDTLDVTTVVVTHDMDTAFEVSDRIVMIHGGTIVFSGSVEESRSTDNTLVRDFIEGNAPIDEDTQTLLRSAG